MPLEDVRHLILWHYEVRPGCEDRFLKIYGPTGDWARLFSSSSMYYGTFLQQDAKHPNRYCTFDLWASPAAFEAFQAQHAREYEALDRECEELTLSEKRIGGFDRRE
jgi:heme-degrading monooxygenase HmoA